MKHDDAWLIYLVVIVVVATLAFQSWVAAVVGAVAFAVIHPAARRFLSGKDRR